MTAPLGNGGKHAIQRPVRYYPHQSQLGRQRRFTSDARKAKKGMEPMHVYEVRPRKNHRAVDLISDALPLGRLWYCEPNEASNAIDYAKFRSRSHDAPVVAVIGRSGTSGTRPPLGRFLKVS